MSLTSCRVVYCLWYLDKTLESYERLLKVLKNSEGQLHKWQKCLYCLLSFQFNFPQYTLDCIYFVALLIKNTHFELKLLSPSSVSVWTCLQSSRERVNILSKYHLADGVTVKLSTWKITVPVFLKGFTVTHQPVISNAYVDFL